MRHSPYVTVRWCFKQECVYVVRSVVRHFTGRNIVRILAIVHCIDLNADVLKVNAGLGK